MKVLGVDAAVPGSERAVVHLYVNGVLVAFVGRTGAEVETKARRHLREVCQFGELEVEQVFHLAR